MTYVRQTRAIWSEKDIVTDWRRTSEVGLARECATAARNMARKLRPILFPARRGGLGYK